LWSRESIELRVGGCDQALSVCIREALWRCWSEEMDCENERGRVRSFATGISPHVRPSSILPVSFFRVPPHCLKKKGTLCASHKRRILLTHSGSIGRHFGPDSPPTITQSMPSRSRPGISASNGSIERNRTAEGTSRRSFIRNVYAGDSTLTPIHTFVGHGSVWASRRNRSDLFVSI